MKIKISVKKKLQTVAPDGLLNTCSIIVVVDHAWIKAVVLVDNCALCKQSKIIKKVYIDTYFS